MTICILGRQPALGLAELEALYGASTVRPLGGSAALVDGAVDFARLGGSQKAGEVLTTLPGTNPQKAFLWLKQHIAATVAATEGKIKLGVSLYGLQMPVQKIGANTLSLKKVLRDAGHSVRVVPNTDAALSSAQSHHNNLADERGCEIMIVGNGESMTLARLTDVQNIDAYRRRDQERPHRDTYVGMLPPKLAQTIINLAAGDRLGGTLLDPFCGTGVLLQEAALIGYEVYGTDIEEKMIRYSEDNLAWFENLASLTIPRRLEVADATDHVWRQPLDLVACEGYLGHPFANEPDKKALMESVQTCNVIMRKFLKNISGQLEPGTRLCIAAPAWRFRGGMEHLPVIESLAELGFERLTFSHAKNDDLVYFRTDQVVARQLLVLAKK